MCAILAMGLNETQGAVKGVPSKAFYVYREPGMSDAEYEKIKRNMLEYRNTMDRILEAHYAPSSRTSTMQKEKVELLRRNRETQDPRSAKATQAKHAKPMENNRAESEVNGKGLEKSSRGRQSLGRSRESG